MDMNAPDHAEAPMALNHIVLNVRDMEESHRSGPRSSASAMSAPQSREPIGQLRRTCGSIVAIMAAES